MTLIPAFLLTSCDLTEASLSDLALVDQGWVTGEAALALGPDGRFHSLAGAPEYAEDLAMDVAMDIGLTYLRTFGPLLRNWLEDGHGGPIDFEQVGFCGRQHFLRSSFEPLHTDIPLNIDGSVSGQWLFTYCNPGGTPVVLHNVPSRTGVRVNEGRLDIPPTSAGDIVSFGIPLSSPRLTQDPEKAVALVYRATTTRITSVPVAVHNNFTIGPPLSAGEPPPFNSWRGTFWKVRTETPADVVELETGASRSTDVFYVVMGYSHLSRGAVFIAPDGPLPEPFWHRAFPADSVLLTPREPRVLVQVRACPTC